MPPKLALLLCTGFVLWTLRVEARNQPRASVGFWLVTVWLLYCASRPLERWFNPGGGDSGMAGHLDPLFLSVVILWGGILIFKRGLGLSEVVRDNPYVVALYALMALSLLWSDYPDLVAKRWVKSAGSVVMACLLLTEKDPQRALVRALRISVYVLLPFSVVVSKYFPHLGMDFHPWSGELSWTGVATQKNGLGRLCLFSAFFLFWDWSRRRASGGLRNGGVVPMLDGIMFALAVYLMMYGGASSATSIGALAVGVGVLTLLWGARGNPGLERLIANGMLVTGASVVVMHNLNLLSSPLSRLASLFGREETFTGRTDIWADLLVQVGKTPILGMGYGSVWVDPPTSIPVNEAHNGYLEVVLQLGAVGMLIVGLLLWSFHRTAVARLATDREWASLGIAFIGVTLTYNLMESALVRGTTHLWTLLLFLVVLSSRASVRGAVRKAGAGNHAAPPAATAMEKNGAPRAKAKEGEGCKK